MDDATFKKAMAEADAAFRAQQAQGGQVEKALVLQWAMAEVTGMVNALQVLMAHVQAGTPGTRELLTLLMGNLDRTRALLKGITVAGNGPLGQRPDG